ncbi:S4 domain-containing protein YaaA [Filobacillus milosensis]|uniref:S4 domain-containing protein YaaA n=1 Tax=Filobacillus milosensis TaxID=94137 RepID=A0A4Y8IJW2_9BACI|nr:S4 domain-containing protein YaaA [Filobacillus milosensis]TFB21099.1 S4 domain-containing protein YaaA [Filobacillus milosensis]
MPEIIEIDTEEITLGQFLKLANIIDSGGMAKVFLKEFDVYVNGELDDRRGRKLKVDDIVEIDEVGAFQVGRAED